MEKILRVVAQIRKQGEKSILSIFYNADKNDWSVFLKPRERGSFNYVPDPKASVKAIIEDILKIGAEMDKKKAVKKVVKKK